MAPINTRAIRARVSTAKNASVSLRTIQRYTRAMNIQAKAVIRRTKAEGTLSPSTLHAFRFLSFLFFSLIVFGVFCFLFFVLKKVSYDFCCDIAAFRCWARRLRLRHLLVWDESALHVGEAPSTTLVEAGQTPLVLVEENSAYAERYDIIMVISYNRVLPPMIYGPADRKALRVDGINTQMILTYITNLLAQAIAALDVYPMYLLLDRAAVHNSERMMEAFLDGGCQCVKEIRKYPPKAAKRLSPLDNTLIHTWKENCRARYPITRSNIKQVMNDSLFAIPQSQIKSFFRHCGYTAHHFLYYDCPLPQHHKHPAT